MKRGIRFLAVLILTVVCGLLCEETVCYAGAGHPTGSGGWGGFYRVGDIVTFGRYEQDNDPSNGKEPIEWRVLEVDDASGRVLLLSLYGLDVQPYEAGHQGTRLVTWESCSLRKWLNGTFLNDAFTWDEQSGILTSYHGDNDASSSVYFRTGPEGDRQAEDRVFLLSYHDADSLYFYETRDNGSFSFLVTSDKERRCGVTEYAAAKGAFVSREHDVNGRPTCRWWLRTPRTLNGRTYNAYIVRTGGDIDIDGPGAGYMAVRPAVWVEKSALGRARSDAGETMAAVFDRTNSPISNMQAAGSR